MPDAGASHTGTVPPEPALPGQRRAARRGVRYGRGPAAAQTSLSQRWEGASRGSGSGDGAAGAWRGPTGFLRRQTGEPL